MRFGDSRELDPAAGPAETIDDRALPDGAAARERLRLGQLLHDDIQQRLYSLRIQLIDVRDALLRADPVPRPTVEALEAADTTLLGTIHALRRLTKDLASPDEDMHTALAAIGMHMRSLHGLNVEFAYDLGVSEPCAPVRATVTRVIRELLFNVVKHSGAVAARVSAQSDGDVLHVEVRDEGRGFSTPAIPPPGAEGGGFGLTDALASLQSLGGDMAVVTAPGTGTSVRVSVPLRARAQPA